MNRLPTCLAVCLALGLAACGNDSPEVPGSGVAGPAGNAAGESAIDAAIPTDDDPESVGPEFAGPGGLVPVNAFGDSPAITPLPLADVVLEARVRLWSDASLRIDYALTNGGSRELIVFDVGPVTSTAFDEDGVVTLFQAQRDAALSDTDERLTIGGRNLSPAQSLEGSASRDLPLAIDFVMPAPELPPVVDTIRFCIGYGDADDVTPTTLADGTYPLLANIDRQTLVCQFLERG